MIVKIAPIIDNPPVKIKAPSISPLRLLGITHQKINPEFHRLSGSKQAIGVCGRKNINLSRYYTQPTEFSSTRIIIKRKRSCKTAPLPIHAMFEPKWPRFFANQVYRVFGVVTMITYTRYAKLKENSSIASARLETRCAGISPGGDDHHFLSAGWIN